MSSNPITSQQPINTYLDPTNTETIESRYKVASTKETRYKILYAVAIIGIIAVAVAINVTLGLLGQTHLLIFVVPTTLIASMVGGSKLVKKIGAERNKYREIAEVEKGALEIYNNFIAFHSPSAPAGNKNITHWNQLSDEERKIDEINQIACLAYRSFYINRHSEHKDKIDEINKQEPKDLEPKTVEQFVSENRTKTLELKDKGVEAIINAAYFQTILQNSGIIQKPEEICKRSFKDYDPKTRNEMRGLVQLKSELQDEMVEKDIANRGIVFLNGRHLTWDGIGSDVYALAKLMVSNTHIAPAS